MAGARKIETVGAALSVVASLYVGVQAQEAVGLSSNYRAPRTADGVPDISGIWRNDTLTPLERPIRLGDRGFLTEEEVAEICLLYTSPSPRDS